MNASNHRGRSVFTTLLAVSAILVLAELGDARARSLLSEPVATSTTDSAGPLLPERLEVTIPASQMRKVVVQNVLVHVDNGKEFADIRARVVSPQKHRWLTVHGFLKALTVVSPSTQEIEVSIDPAELPDTGAEATVEILGANSKTLRLPVVVRIASATSASGGSPSPDISEKTQSSGDRAVAPESPAIASSPPGSGSSADRTTSTLQASPRALTFVVTPLAPPPLPQDVTVSAFLQGEGVSPIVTYKVAAIAARPRQGSPAGSDQPQPSDEEPQTQWITVDPNGELRLLEGNPATHAVSVNPGALPAGQYHCFLVFRTAAGASARVFVTMTIESRSN